MAGNRGDDIVLAGSGGQRPSATLSALFDQTHRSTSLILAIDSLIIVLIAWDFASIAQLYAGRAALLLWVIPLFVTTSIWFSYRSRRTWAYWPAALIIGMAAVLFFLLFLINLYNVIAGAGIDVYDKEPLPAGHKLRFVPNALLLPHLGYVTAEN